MTATRWVRITVENPQARGFWLKLRQSWANASRAWRETWRPM